ncbi:MAG: alpha-glucan phosphorylase [Bacteroidetes bacterium 4572_117]|nr:MAG: alpha-glucan phosphorylase [Bacteroidetes bacterium 4572_117]
MQKPNYIFETSWEVCNKVGGIHTVVSTKAITLQKELKDGLIMLGPDLHRDESVNPEFEEDNNLFPDWKQAAEKEGLRIKIGRWKIVGKPVVILIDFSPFIAQKNEIFRRFWDLYQLDSLSGHWDYIEPAIFGYAAAKVVESFYNNNLSAKDKVVAHFHEWMTGTGLLYLKDQSPLIATAFTTHATAIGRSIAGNGLPLYSKLDTYNGDLKAKEFNIISKQSLEKISAREADVFTTVSEITSKECSQFHEKDVDIVTPNGFEDDFVPVGTDFDEKRAVARKKLREVSEALFGYKLPENIKFVASSGRYEFSNKGLDVFVDALGKANKDEKTGHNTVAFVLVPANNYGARKDLLHRLENGGSPAPNENNILTHYLHDAEYDPVLNKVTANKLQNDENDKVKIIFVPVYLNGEDGIFNLDYWDLLIGFDLTVFPSYYEPWGYTPLESLAFYIPTVTTTLSGFGRWILKDGIELSKCLKVIDRNDENYQFVVDQIAETIVLCSLKDDKFFKNARKNAFDVSRIALWKNLIKYYYEAYDKALRKSKKRSKKHSKIIAQKEREKSFTSVTSYKSNKPIWRGVQVKSNFNGKFERLNELAKNLWWSWNPVAQELFSYINHKKWVSSKNNPTAFLQCLDYNRIKELEKDKHFIELYTKVLIEFDNYQKRPYDKNAAKIAYFSMEFGISSNLKIYSGGLGILAGDYLKQASDSNIDMVAVGLLYKYGYFKQSLSIKGEQQVNYLEQNFAKMPVNLLKDNNGKAIYIELVLPGRIVKIQIWLVEVGKVKLYLLDTDRPDNQQEDRELTWSLYGRGNDYRLKQELILGIGGIRALEKLGIKKDVYHLNEGHAAFAGIERINQLMKKENLTYSESREIVRASSLFTTHTPVPAGHDAFKEDEILPYLGHYPERLKISWDEFIDLGRSQPGNISEKFSMSYLAANLSQEINGVSKLHGEVTKDMFNKLWDGYFPQESHIGYVTNGVHMPSWTSKGWLNLYKNLLGDKFISGQAELKLWEKLKDISNEELWQHRKTEKKELFDFIKSYLDEKGTRLYESPKHIAAIRKELNEDYLTIGFARRFATYKRGDLLFRDMERIKSLMNNTEKPIRFIFAGKAHPNDGGGQAIIKEIIRLSKEPGLLGKIIFLEDYDIELAKKLVQGVDIWLNTPTRPLEASGTSGMKAVMNGVLNLSVLDGWWVEGYRENAGWALDEKRVYDNQDFQDELDSETIYNLLENEIAPMYYDCGKNKHSEKWLAMIRKNIMEIAPNFTMKRMLDDYIERFYTKLHARKNEINANDYQLAKDIAAWKKKVKLNWDKINVESIHLSNPLSEDIELGKEYIGKVVLDFTESEHIETGVEVVITDNKEDEQTRIIYIQEMKLESFENNKASYFTKLLSSKQGDFSLGIRIFPKHPNLLYRQDFSYVKWI